MEMVGIVKCLFHLNAWCHTFLLTSFLPIIHPSGASEILRPRGVSISKASLYVPDRDFTCFDGSATIPFSYVNDDYCDCNDGSDEPGTPACPNGIFHCTNAGHKPLNIPSSRVNDGICDCCDTSDEYASLANCVNNCNELGRAARVEAQKLAELSKQGSELRVQFIRKGKEMKQSKQERLDQLMKDEIEAEQVRKDKERLKLAAEEVENNALAKYRKEEEEKKHKEQEEEKLENEKEAFEYFHKIDSNQDGRIQVDEIQTRQTFDQNRDGAVSEDEAKVKVSCRNVDILTPEVSNPPLKWLNLEAVNQLVVEYFLDQHEEMSWEDFLVSAWPRMKPLLMLDKGMFQPPAATTAPDEAEDMAEDTAEAAREVEEDRHEDDDEEEEEEEEEEDDSHPEDQDPSAYGEEEHEEEEMKDDKKAESEAVKPKYDEETQRLIEEANLARSQYEEADRSVRDISREIQQIKQSMQKDFGLEEEFAPLDGECFEYTDTEYVYKLCPFDQATQRSRSGGAETRLGSWGKWSGSGPQDDKYRTMMYDGGQACWNGPQRSAQVKLSCGTENAITSVSEPNRCEYVFEFTTPAVCKVDVVHEHDEL